ncbi:MAG: YhdH/YhfP family quinone oxidoreductase [Bacteroidota bacterium]
MPPVNFKALRITESSKGQFERAIVSRSTDDLPTGEVLIQVHFAALNYKDALSSSGHKGVTRNFPHTPGIDAAGVVAESSNSAFAAGDKVLVTGFDLGMNTDGGFGAYIRVPAEWVVPLPDGYTLEEAMIVGTGGFTAAIGLYKMEKQGQHPAAGPIVVSGASGGVGSLAVGILAKAGYEVFAVTGKASAHDYLKDLGAKEILSRADVDDQTGRPLLRPKWAGAIDTVGGNTLATLIKTCSREGNVAACGLVGSHDLNLTVYPFILNGVNLLGIDSATFPRAERLKVWQKLATDWRVPNLERIATHITLEELDPYLDKILAGDNQGRVIVKHEH